MSAPVAKTAKVQKGRLVEKKILQHDPLTLNVTGMNQEVGYSFLQVSISHIFKNHTKGTATISSRLARICKHYSCLYLLTAWKSNRFFRKLLYERIHSEAESRVVATQASEQERRFDIRVAQQTSSWPSGGNEDWGPDYTGLEEVQKRGRGAEHHPHGNRAPRKVRFLPSNLKKVVKRPFPLIDRNVSREQLLAFPCFSILLVLIPKQQQ